MHTDVLPRRNARGKYVLQEIITTDEVYHDRRDYSGYKIKRHLWKPAKLDNGRGIQFDTWKKAMEFFRDNRESYATFGNRTRGLLDRL